MLQCTKEVHFSASQQWTCSKQAAMYGGFNTIIVEHFNKLFFRKIKVKKTSRFQTAQYIFLC